MSKWLDRRRGGELRSARAPRPEEWEASPESMLLRGEEMRRAGELEDRIAELIGRLPVREAEVTALRWKADPIPWAVVAEVLGSTVQTVRTLEGRARRRIRAWLTEGEDSGNG